MGAMRPCESPPPKEAPPKEEGKLVERGCGDKGRATRG